MKKRQVKLTEEQLIFMADVCDAIIENLKPKGKRAVTKKLVFSFDKKGLELLHGLTTTLSDTIDT